MAFDYDQYIRGGKLPHIWCPGCTYGIVFKSILRVVDTLKMNRCSERFSWYAVLGELSKAQFVPASLAWITTLPLPNFIGRVTWNPAWPVPNPALFTSSR